MDLTWKEISSKVDGMFTQQYELFSRRPVHFMVTMVSAYRSTLFGVPMQGELDNR